MTLSPVSDSAAANLRAFVERDGTIVVSLFSGVADEHGTRLDDVDLPPGGLAVRREDRQEP
ncbi:hypothetical protein Mth01_24010 [Sphaerimonospora thailandensis]|uniref:Uncharacterized protein n=1 Tax=Sphaerimonospora thailandensis TaxID=795644 RepID=A0A8J3R804_9ACTN|nr:hypothetical protein Mth01_24010 [Sphaerimonospora thailandensis]